MRGLVGSLEDIENIVVKNNTDGLPILIRNIARIRFGNANRYGAMTYNDQGEVVGAIVMMLKGSNSSKVIKKVKERILQIEKTLPEGVEIVPYLDRTKLVTSAIQTVTKKPCRGCPYRRLCISASTWKLSRRAHCSLRHSTGHAVCHHPDELV